MDDQEIVDTGGELLGEQRSARLFCALRIGTSYLCLVLCVVIVTFWVRSYFSFGLLNGRLSDTLGLVIQSWEGRITSHGIMITDQGPYMVWSWSFLSAEEVRKTLEGASPPPSFFGFSAHIYPPEWRGSIPHWFLFFVMAALAVLLKPKPRLRFSLRGLLIVVTMSALMLGAIEALTHNSR